MDALDATTEMLNGKAMVSSEGLKYRIKNKVLEVYSKEDKQWNPSKADFIALTKMTFEPSGFVLSNTVCDEHIYYLNENRHQDPSYSEENIQKFIDRIKCEVLPISSLKEAVKKLKEISGGRFKLS